MSIQAIKSAIEGPFLFVYQNTKIDAKVAKVAIAALALGSLTLINVYYPKIRAYTLAIACTYLAVKVIAIGIKFVHFSKSSSRRQLDIQQLELVRKQPPSAASHAPSVRPFAVENYLKRLPHQFEPVWKQFPSAASEASSMRTVMMEENLERSPHYNPKQKQLDINGVPHRVVDGTVVNFARCALPLVCVGANEREYIVLDPKASPELEKCYQDFRALIGSSVKVDRKQVLKALQSHLKNVFPGRSKATEAFIQECRQKYDGRGPFCIPIESFIEAKCGVCRHHSLLGAYLLDRFLHEHADKCTFKGKVFVMRHNLVEGAHAWISLVLESGEIYLVDTLNRVVGDINDPKFVSAIRGVFGDKAIANQKKKAVALKQK